MLKNMTICALALSLSTSLFAQEELFLSLTRKAAPAADLPTNVSIISSQMIQERKAATLGELLESETGINRITYGTLGQVSSAKIRGASSEQVLVLVDGRRVNSFVNGGVDLSTIPTEMIERVEIIRGSAAAIYGTSAVGGVINVITKRPSGDTMGLGLTAGYGSFNTQRAGLDLSVAHGRTGAIVTIARKTSDGWRDHSEYVNDALFARLIHDAQSAGVFDLSGSTFHSDLNVPGEMSIGGTPITTDDYDGTIETQTLTPNAVQRQAKDYLRLGHEKQWTRETLQTSIYTSRDITSYADKNIYATTDDEYRSSSFGGETRLLARGGLTAGIEWWQELFTQMDKVTTTEKLTKSRTTAALYLQEELAIGAFAVTPSLRMDKNSEFGTVVSPRATVLYHVSDELKLSANSGKTWRAPTFNELYYPLDAWGNQGNKDLKPESGISSDVGAQYTAESFRVSVTYFTAFINDLIEWGFSPKNIGKASQQGVECLFAQKLSPALKHTVNYTYLWAEDTENKRQLNYRPQNQANYAVTFSPAGLFSVTGTIVHVGPRKTVSLFHPVTEIEGYTLLGARMTRQAGLCELWASCENITDEKYQSVLGYPLPGTTYAAGLTWTFNGTTAAQKP